MSSSEVTQEPTVVRHLEGGHSSAGQRNVLAFWLDHRWCDWAGCLLVGTLIRVVLVPLTDLRAIDPAIRFSVYAAIAAGIFAVVAIAFTPLAIMTALAPGRDLDRLRVHDDDIRHNFLLGTLWLLLCSLVLIGCGAADASQNPNSAAEIVASFTLGMAIMKTLRLTALFAAILGASSKDGVRDRRRRSKGHAA